MDTSNMLPFSGILTRVSEPSDKAPTGSRGHCVLLTRKAALAGLPTLADVPINYTDTFCGHETTQICGFITKGWLEDDDLHVAGFVNAEFVKQIGALRLGMSYEIANAHIEDMRAKVWEITKATFTGAAILLRSKAAYGKSSFQIKKAAIPCIEDGGQIGAYGYGIAASAQ